MKANSKAVSLLIVTGAYLLAIAAAAGTLHLLKSFGWHPIWRLALADVIGTLVIYGFSLGFRNSSFYDPYWSVAPPLFLLALWPVMAESEELGRCWLVVAAVVIWAIRLTANWARHWPGIRHQDWRYTMLKKDGSFKAFAADFFGIHLFPTFMVFMGCLPLAPAMLSHRTPVGWLDWLALAICLLATGIELLADEQLRIFKLRSTDPQAFMQSGIWSWSRHPNYFGEWLFWVGIFVFGLAADPSSWWMGIGAVLMLGMFLFASVPMMEKRMMKKRPGYVEYKRKVSGFFPWPF